MLKYPINIDPFIASKSNIETYRVEEEVNLKRVSPSLINEAFDIINVVQQLFEELPSHMKVTKNELNTYFTILNSEMVKCHSLFHRHPTKEEDRRLYQSILTFLNDGLEALKIYVDLSRNAHD